MLNTIDMDERLPEAVASTPAPPLRSIIRRYHGYRSTGTPALHRGLPSGQLTFIISLDAPVDIARMPDNLQGPGRFQAFIGGLHASPAYIRHDGYQHGISLELTPFGARSLLGMPAGELAHAVVPLEDLLGPAASSLVDRLLGAAGWREQFAVLDEVLVAKLKDHSGPPREVIWVWDQLVARAGRIGVSALAAEVGYSRRHLGELFRRELGLAPKAAARVLRFEASRRLIGRPGFRGLAGVAAAAGYYDQAHMARDWSELAGCSPSVWIREELPSVQDEPVDLDGSSEP